MMLLKMALLDEQPKEMYQYYPRYTKIPVASPGAGKNNSGQQASVNRKSENL